MGAGERGPEPGGWASAAAQRRRGGDRRAGSGRSRAAGEWGGSDGSGPPRAEVQASGVVGAGGCPCPLALPRCLPVSNTVVGLLLPRLAPRFSSSTAMPGWVRSLAPRGWSYEGGVLLLRGVVGPKKRRALLVVAASLLCVQQQQQQQQRGRSRGSARGECWGQALQPGAVRGGRGRECWERRWHCLRWRVHEGVASSVHSAM